MGKNIVELTGVNKIYGTNHVVKDLTLTVEEGEFLTLLGSSGCGKTTTLRMIAGFEEPTTGSIKVEGEAIEEKEPYERDVNTVFQSYALFPHKTIYDNIAYGLKMKKVPKKEIAERVKEMMELVQLEGFEKRYPNQLSGGQKQLISFARTLLSDPKILVLDEATSSIDARTEKLLQQGLQRLLVGRTSFIIAHRLSTIKNCDKIMYIDNKGIAECGTHDQLIAKKGEYYKLYTAQHMDE